ncbi:MAG: hypothetical protein LBQ52_04700 [Helicobacteraceae bacterium]|jgi:hypothetical protein|nr:hypothetical protein [Helicobacteraceae bacterium]
MPIDRFSDLGRVDLDKILSKDGESVKIDNIDYKAEVDQHSADGGINVVLRLIDREAKTKIGSVVLFRGKTLKIVNINREAELLEALVG